MAREPKFRPATLADASELAVLVDAPAIATEPAIVLPDFPHSGDWLLMIKPLTS
jgi:hypothetical protein